MELGCSCVRGRSLDGNFDQVVAVACSARREQNRKCSFPLYQYCITVLQCVLIDCRGYNRIFGYFLIAIQVVFFEDLKDVYIHIAFR